MHVNIWEDMSLEYSTEGPVTKVNVGRLTNAIFAFTLLLLFKNIRLPSFSDTLTETPVEKFGLMQIPDILSFINAFIIIAMFWMVTFHIYHQLKRIDRTYLYHHFGLLVMIIFIPITSHLYQIFEGNAIMSILFHLNMLIISISLIFEWAHIKNDRKILIPNCIESKVTCISRKILYIPLTATFGIFLSIFDLPLTRNLYYGTMILFLLDWFVTQKKQKNTSGGERE